MDKIPYFDAHCDTISRCVETGEDFTGEDREFYAVPCSLRRSEGHIDLERTERAFSRYAQFFAFYRDGRGLTQRQLLTACARQHERFLREMEENKDRIRLCRTGEEIDRAAADGVAAALLSIEGAELLTCDPGRVAQAAQWGMRIINPVWNRTNALSGTNLEDPDRGLSAQGRDFIREMEGCGIYADVSHLSDPGFWDLVRMAHRPILASHSNSRAVCPHRRNLTDDMLRAIRNTGGVVGLNLYQSFVGPDETMDGLVRQIEHMLDIAGEETLCIGGDLDGCEKLAGGLRGVEDVPRIWAALAGRGYPRPLLENIFWNNLRRLF